MKISIMLLIICGTFSQISFAASSLSEHSGCEVSCSDGSSCSADKWRSRCYCDGSRDRGDQAVCDNADDRSQFETNHLYKKDSK